MLVSLIEKSAVKFNLCVFFFFCVFGLLVVIETLFGLLYLHEKNSMCELIIQFYKSDSYSMFESSCAVLKGVGRAYFNPLSWIYQ